MARYAKAGDYHIAYVVEGKADMDLLWVPTWISQCEHLFTEPSLAALGKRIQRFARTIAFDRRGAGLSDPMIGAPTLEEQMDDVLAVMDACGSERAAVFGSLEGGPLAALFAATYPDRVQGLILYSTFARATRTSDYHWTWTEEERDARMQYLTDHWGEGLTAGGIAPSRLDDPEFMEWAARMERLAASPATIKRIVDLIGEFDVRHVLPSIRVPTLVMHRRNDTFLDFRHGEYIASRIPDAKFLELEGSDNLFSMGDVDAFAGEVEEFLTGTRYEKEPDRMLATVLFAPTSATRRRGRPSWVTPPGGGCSSSTTRSSAAPSSATAAMRSRARATASSPPSTARRAGLRCAASIAARVRSLGIEVRAGLHTGEVEVMNGDIGGLAVHIGARVMGAAGPGEVLVSSTVKDLVVGSGIEFAERGSHELKGVPGEWRLFAVD